ncbi:MAG: GNAT family N-acetyltransferase [Pirellulaceae bacterium]
MNQPNATPKQIPVAEPDLSGNEERFVVDAMRSSWISSSGKYLDQFESQFASDCGADTALGVCNGTVALHLALMALDVRPGDEVLIPSLTYIATANACKYVGAEPIFIDVDEDTWCIDPTKLEAAITRKTRGIIAVHLYGHPADMDAINHVAAVHGLWVIEDAAEAHFARYKGRVVGSLARCATFSFYGNKIITSGEGGAVTVSDAQLELRMRTLRGQGVDPTRRYFFPVTGYNFRMTNIAAAILCAQLERKEAIVSKRRQIYSWYRERLCEIDGIGFQPVADWAEITPWLMSVVIEQDFGLSRNTVALQLSEAGIDTRPFFIPLHRLPPFRHESQARREVLPVTDRLANSGLNLPTYTGMDEGTVDHICKALAIIWRKSRRQGVGFHPSQTTASIGRVAEPATNESYQSNALSFEPLGVEHVDGLLEFLETIARSGDMIHFHPHPFDLQTVQSLANEVLDVYYVALIERRVAAYGMLRGWKEGFDRPSLGIAVSPEHRNRGLGRMFILFLHSIARSRGSQEIRLTVSKDNCRAVQLYESLGYRFEELHEETFEGTLKLAGR